ncbi:invertase inhibitor [Tanacetum coccineum]
MATKILFFFLFISPILISNAYTFSKVPYELVNKVCHEQANNVEFCLAVLKSDNSSKFAKDVATLTNIVVHVATNYSTRTRDHFKGLQTGPPGLLKSLKECVPAYDNVIASLKICLKEEECELTGYDIHVAGDEVRRCQTIADGNGARGSFITPANNVTLDFCILGESLANLMCDKI